jgi:hypothetical protein
VGCAGTPDKLLQNPQQTHIAAALLDRSSDDSCVH